MYSCSKINTRLTLSKRKDWLPAVYFFVWDWEKKQHTGIIFNTKHYFLQHFPEFPVFCYCSFQHKAIWKCICSHKQLYNCSAAGAVQLSNLFYYFTISFVFKAPLFICSMRRTLVINNTSLKDERLILDVFFPSFQPNYFLRHINCAAEISRTWAHVAYRLWSTFVHCIRFPIRQ